MTKADLGDLILQSERQMYQTAKSILRDDNDCADAIQETIVKAFVKIDTLKEDKFAKTWLIRILINECYNLIRNGKKQVPYVYIDDLPEMQAKEKADYSDLYHALNLLKDELRIPVVLYYIEDFSIREIAEIMEISEGAVQKRLVRARAKLKVELGQMEVIA